MPSYGFLFRDERGNDLVTYLETLATQPRANQQSVQDQWQPKGDAIAAADIERGGRLYKRDCSMCHDANGATRGKWANKFARQPTDLQKGPFRHVSVEVSAQQRLISMARIIKFGVPGTDMPGHEYLSDRDISSLSLWLEQNHANVNH